MITYIFYNDFLNLYFYIYGFFLFLGFFFFFLFFFLSNFLNLNFFLYYKIFFFYSILIGFFFSRLFYILVEWNFFFVSNFFCTLKIFNYYLNFPSFLAIWKGGLILYGFLFGFFFSVFLFFFFHNIDVNGILNKIIFFFPISMIFGRLGCLFIGCCWGREIVDFLKFKIIYSFPILVRYPFNSYSYINNNLYLYDEKKIKIFKEIGFSGFFFPYQIIELFFFLFLFFFFFFLKDKNIEVYFFPIFFFLYSLFRILTEFLRGDYLNELGLKFFFLNHYFYFFSFLFFIIYLIIIYLLKYVKKKNKC